VTENEQEERLYLGPLTNLLINRAPYWTINFDYRNFFSNVVTPMGWEVLAPLRTLGYADAAPAPTVEEYTAEQRKRYETQRREVALRQRQEEENTKRANEESGKKREEEGRKHKAEETKKHKRKKRETEQTKKRKHTAEETKKRETEETTKRNAEETKKRKRREAEESKKREDEETRQEISNLKETIKERKEELKEMLGVFLEKVCDVNIEGFLRLSDLLTDGTFVFGEVVPKESGNSILEWSFLGFATVLLFTLDCLLTLYTFYVVNVMQIQVDENTHLAIATKILKEQMRLLDEMEKYCEKAVEFGILVIMFDDWI